MDINDTYNQLKTLQLKTSQRHFSQTFLSKSQSYLSMIIATQRQPSRDTLIRLSQHLSYIADTVEKPLAECLTCLSGDVLAEALKK